MKKLSILGLVLVLLAFSVAPVMAAKPNNGHGNGNSAGQDNGKQDRQQDRIHSNRGHSKTSLNVMGNNNQGMRKPFYLQGTIVSIDAGAKTLTIDVFHGNARVKQFIDGTNLLVKTDFTPRIFKIIQGGEQGGESEGSESAVPSTSSSDATLSTSETSGNKHAISFGELHAGDIVAIHGLVVLEDFEATKITVFTQGIGGLPETTQP